MAPPVKLKALTHRQAERRRRILASALTLVGKLGYDSVTMRMIAQESATAEKTLYNIFGTKDRLVALAAHDRSADVFALAARREPRSGWPRLREFARAAAEVTLEAPVLSRALAGLLLDHAELVGLQDVYESEVGAILRAMAVDGLLTPDAPPEALVRVIRLAVVSAVLFWAKDQIADAELEPYIIRRCAETLLPFATPSGVVFLLDEARAAALGTAPPEPVTQDL